MPEVENVPVRWATGGADGLVKLWELVPGQIHPGKKVKQDPSTVRCAFTSTPSTSTLPNRSDAVKRRQTGKPDDIIFVRFAGPIVACVTADGDLRLFDADLVVPEVRIDVGGAELEGDVDRMELNVRGQTASVLIHHKRSPTLARYDINLQDGSHTIVNFESYDATPITAVSCHLRPMTPISSTQPAPPILSTPLLAPLDALPCQAPAAPTSSPTSDQGNFGRLVVTGDHHGYVSIWAWDGRSGSQSCVKPIRSWRAMTGKITALDYSCGLVAVGSYDGYIKVFDPLPSEPELLRAFHASHVSLADGRIAVSEDPDARWYTVNHIILESDLVVASIGRKIFAWKAGTGKGRTKGEGARKGSTGKSIKGNTADLGESDSSV